MTDTLDHPHAQRRKFRELLARPQLTVMPGGFSPLYARMAEEIGFETFFVAGSQTAAFLYGVPDNGIIGLREIAEHVRHVAARAGIPILVDCDTGYGNAVNVTFAVEEIIRTGAAAMSLEDQEAPKKSAHAGRTPLHPARRSARQDQSRDRGARRHGSDLLDLRTRRRARRRKRHDRGCDRRGVAYAKEGRADLIWLNSVETLDDCAAPAKRSPRRSW